MLFQRLLEESGKSTLVEVWPALEVVVHGGVKFDPYREAFRAIVGSQPRPAPGDVPVLRGIHRLRRPARPGSSAWSSTTASSTSSSRSTSWSRRGRRGTGSGTAEAGVNYAIVVSTCAGMWAHVIGDTVRFESLASAALDLHRADPVHALGLRRAPDQRGARGGDRAGRVGDRCVRARLARRAGLRGALGYHQYVVEFLGEPAETSQASATGSTPSSPAQRRLPRAPHSGRRPPVSRRVGGASRGFRGLDAQSREARRTEQGPACG